MLKVANPKSLRRAAASKIRPRKQIRYNDWARENVVFGPDEPFPGPYDDTRFPYFPPILDALQDDDPCNTVSICKSAQLGGTIIANIFAGASMENGPCKLMYVQATEAAAKSWLNEKMGPFLRRIKGLRALFPDKAKGVINTDQLKETYDKRGLIEAVSAQSPDDLAMKTRQKQIQDDLAKFQENSIGDPEAQADSRSDAYEFHKKLKISTPTLWPGCKITKNYREGTQEEWHVPCPHCGVMQALAWENFRDNIDEEYPENSHFKCIHCNGEIHNHHKPKIIPQGFFIAKNPAAAKLHRSFYIWMAYSPLRSFEVIARKWLSVRGIPTAEQVFMNNVIGVAYEVAGVGAKAADLKERSEQSDYDLGVIPPGYYELYLGIDCQDDRVEWTLVAYGRNVRRAVIQKGIIPHHISEDEAKRALTELIKRRWRNFAGHYLSVRCTGIDANAYRDDVGDWAKRHPKAKVIMLRGVANDNMPPLQAVKWEYDKRGNRKVNRYKGRFYNFSANAYKMALYRSLAKVLDPLRRSYVAFPRGLDDDYFDQVAAEKRVRRVSKTGFVKYVWEKDPNQANEALDMLNQAEAAARRSGVFDASDEYWDILEAEFGQPEPDGQMDLEDMLMAKMPESVAPEKVAQVAEKLDCVVQAVAKPSEPEPESPTLKRMREMREARKRKSG